MATSSERAVESQAASTRSETFLNPSTARARRTATVVVMPGAASGAGVEAGLAFQA
jgi:hypothetical protein